ncbi:MAG: Clp protease N-terminal domain-containing protein, partial [Pseudomonadota bacterium]
MDMEKLTDRARGFIQAAQTIAVRENHPEVTADHLLQALIDDSEGQAANLITRAGGDVAAVQDQLRQVMARKPQVSGSGAAMPNASRDLVQVLGNAQEIAQKAGDSYVSTDRLLLALTLASGTGAANALSAGGISAQVLNAAVNDIRKGRTADSAGAEQNFDALARYAQDLTEAAAEGRIDPVIGRDEEIRRVVQVLSRRTKNNP